MNQWAPIQSVPDYPRDNTGPPNIVADRNKTVHALSSEQFGDQVVIVYRKWTLESGWSEGNDVLLPPYKNQARLADVLLDEASIIHIIFFGGDDLDANIYYSSAPAGNAGEAGAWSMPIVVGPEAGTPSQARFAGDSNGKLAVVYSGKKDGIGLYATSSEANGESWSKPEAIFLTFDNEKPWALYGYIDPTGTRHIVWSIVDQTGNGQAIYYAKLDTDQESWSDPLEIAVLEGYEADWPSIISYNGELIVVYQNSSPATRFFRVSRDGGRTWTAPIRPFPFVGEYGPADLVIDNNNTLHMLLGDRTGDDNHGMWHSVWTGDSWTPLEPVIRGAVSKAPGAGFDPHQPRAVTVNGNLLFVVWKNDHGFDGVWYSYLLVEGPELPAIPLPTIVPSPTSTPIPESSVSLTVTSTPIVSSRTLDRISDIPETTTQENPSFPIIIGLIPALLLIFVVVGRRFLRL